MSDQDKIDQLEAHNRALVEALEELIAIKSYKNQHGKDEWYEEKQPIAWEKARQALSNSPVDLYRKEQERDELAAQLERIDLLGNKFDRMHRDDLPSRYVAEQIFLILHEESPSTSLAEHDKRVRDEGIEVCVVSLKHEYADTTVNTDGARWYNEAVNDCIQAIRALKTGEKR